MLIREQRVETQLEREKKAREQMAKWNAMPRGELLQLLYDDFRTYCQWACVISFGVSLVLDETHEVIIDALQRYGTGKCKKRSMAIFLEPGVGKSLLVRFFNSWCFVRNPAVKFLYISATDKVRDELAEEIRNLMLLPDWVDMFCPDGPEIDNSKLSGSKSSKLNFRLKSGGPNSGLSAMTSLGNMVGMSAGNPNVDGFPGALVCDDFQPLDVIDQTYTRAQYLKRFKLLQKRRRGRTGTLFIMQMLCLGDIADYICKHCQDEYEIIRIPALKQDEEGYYYATCPFARSAEELLHLKETEYETFMAQHQQDPIPAGGYIFKREWMQKEFNPALQTPDLFETTSIWVDSALEKDEQHDYTVLQLWGRTREGQARAMNQWRGKWDSPELRRKTAEFIVQCRKQFPSLRRIYIEKKASGTGLIQEINAELKRIAREQPSVAQYCWNVSVMPVNKGAKSSKAIVAKDAAGYWEEGRVELPNDASWKLEFISEHVGFNPQDTHAHDDQVDTASMAITNLLGKRSNAFSNL